MSEEKRLPMVLDPDPADLGPCMSACTPLERRYVIALCETGGEDHTRALAMAGDGCTSQESRRVLAMKMYRRPRVQEAMKEETWNRMRSYGLMAASGLIDMARSSRDEKIKFKARIELLNRTGFQLPTQINVRHTDVSKTDDELVRRMVELCRRNPSYIDMVPVQFQKPVLAALPKPKPSEPAGLHAGGQNTIELSPAEYAEPVPDPDADILGE